MGLIGRALLIVIGIAAALPFAPAMQAQSPTPERTPISLGQGYAFSDSTVGGTIYFAEYTVADVPGFSIENVYYTALYAGSEEISAAPLNVYNDGGTEARNRGFTKGLAIVALPEASAIALRDGIPQRLTMRLQPLPSAKLSNSGLVNSNAAQIQTISERNAAKNQFVHLLRSISADWSLPMVTEARLNDVGILYVNGYSADIANALDLGSTVTGALPRRGETPDVGDGPGAITTGRLQGDWSVDEGLGQLAETSGVPLPFLSSGLMILLSIAVYAGARAAFGGSAGAIALVLVLAVGTPVGVAAGFFPAASIMIIVALVGLAGVGYAVVRGMPS